jgi:hypothetical protein
MGSFGNSDEPEIVDYESRRVGASVEDPPSPVLDHAPLVHEAFDTHHLNGIAGRRGSATRGLVMGGDDGEARMANPHRSCVVEETVLVSR